MNWVFVGLLCLPVIEIAVLISVGGVIGLPLTILFVVLTAIIGTFLLRQQGISLLLSAQQQVTQGQVPTQTMIEGVAVAVGGALLLTPGFVTDTVGFLCLIPASRQLIIAVLKRGVLAGGSVFVATSSVKKDTTDSGGVTLEGEYKRDK